MKMKYICKMKKGFFSIMVKLHKCRSSCSWVSTDLNVKENQAARRICSSRYNLHFINQKVNIL